MSDAIPLHDLNARFTRLHPQHGTDAPGGGRRWRTEQNEDGSEIALADAQGISFLCPKCFHQNGGPVGTHSVICWFADRGVSDAEEPGPGRWVPAGTGIDDLSFVGPAAASILLTSEGGCNWHGFIKNGKATLS